MVINTQLLLNSNKSIVILINMIEINIEINNNDRLCMMKKKKKKVKYRVSDR